MRASPRSASPEPPSGTPTSPGPTSPGPTLITPPSGTPTSPAPILRLGPPSGRRPPGTPTSPGQTYGRPTSGTPASGIQTSGTPTSGGPTSPAPTSGTPTSGGPTSPAPSSPGPTLRMSYGIRPGSPWRIRPLPRDRRGPAANLCHTAYVYLVGGYDGMRHHMSSPQGHPSAISIKAGRVAEGMRPVTPPSDGTRPPPARPLGEGLRHKARAAASAGTLSPSPGYHPCSSAFGPAPNATTGLHYIRTGASIPSTPRASLITPRKAPTRDSRAFSRG